MSTLPFSPIAGYQELLFQDVLQPMLFGMSKKELSSTEPGLTADWEDGFCLAMSITKTGKTYLRLRK